MASVSAKAEPSAVKSEQQLVDSFLGKRKPRSHAVPALSKPVIADIESKTPATTAPESMPPPADTKSTSSAPAKKRTKRATKKERPPDLTPEEEAAMRRKASLINAKLCELYPVAPTGFLDHTDAYTLLVAVVLSAQCKDTTVNAVTPSLFAEASTPAAMVALGEARIRALISRIGLANSKARYLYGLSQALLERHNGEVPPSLEEMEALPGVGHKTASVVGSLFFNIPAFPVDTHIHRLACRWGFGRGKSVALTEEMLKRYNEPSTWAALHTRLIQFGRDYCPAMRHDMDECPICAFAATREAIAANRRSTAFVAAERHAAPYEMRGDVERGPIGRTDVHKSDGLSPALAQLSQSPPQPTPQLHMKATEAKTEPKTEPKTRGKAKRGISKAATASVVKKEKKKAAKAKSAAAKPVDESGLRRSNRIKQLKK